MTNLGNMAIGVAWDILNSEPSELTPRQRFLQKNLARRYRERRRPFKQQALTEFINLSLDKFIESELADVQT
jgi:hypothetical protein